MDSRRRFFSLWDWCFPWQWCFYPCGGYLFFLFRFPASLMYFRIIGGRAFFMGGRPSRRYPPLPEKGVNT